MKQAIHSSSRDFQLSDADREWLKERGLEVSRSPDGGLDLVSHNNDLLPKTVTGFLDPVTGEFVAIVIAPDKHKNRVERLMLWRPI